MKNAFIALIFVHGMIHLFGFAKAFDMIEFEQINTNISKIEGVLWFVAFLLFMYVGEAFFSKNSFWYWMAFVAVSISTFLIILFWKKTKFGMLPNILILAVALFSLSSYTFNKKVAHEIKAIIALAKTNKSSVIKKEQLTELPYPVMKWLTISGITGKEKTSTVWLSQKVKLKLKPEQMDWHEAVAKQYFDLENPAFIWQVNMNFPPFIKITGRDKFVNGKGEMQIKMFSLFNLANEKGDKMNEATIQRFLAEVVWFPSAALNKYISWEGIDSLSAKATIKYKGASGCGVFHFNRQGDFVKFSTLRFKENKMASKRHEWIVEVKKHSIMQGIKIPTEVEASWMIENKKWTWIDLTITDIKYNQQKIKNE